MNHQKTKKMKLSKTKQYSISGIVLFYSIVILSVDFFHFHEEKNCFRFHDECPACFWHEQSNGDVCDFVFDINAYIAVFFQYFDKLTIENESILSFENSYLQNCRAPPKLI